MKIIYLFLLLSLSVNAETITGKCTKVHDGDSIWVMVNSKRNVIRLSGIDTPEIKQPHGIESRDALRALVLNKVIRAEYTKSDRYGRLIGTVYKGNQDINLLMLTTGNAWHYKHYDKQKIYADAESKAKNNKIGLWLGTDPVAPWSWRSKKK